MEYHSILIPLEDVYRLGGPDVFKGLARKKEGKNLVIFKGSIGLNLERNKNKSSEGIEYTISIMKSFSNSRLVDGMMIYDLGKEGGIDVAYIPEELEDGLEERIKNTFRVEPKIITRNPNQHLIHRAKGNIVEDPQFLIVSSDIVNEGIIEGSDELQAALYSSANFKIPQEKAEEILQRQLFLNQFIRFLKKDSKEKKSHPFYSRVSGTLKKNQRGTRIIEVRDPFVSFIEGKEFSEGYHIGHQKIDNFFGITPFDIEQYLAVQYCVLNNDIELAFICGEQGSGKTLITYTAAINLILNYPKEDSLHRGLPDDKNSFFKKIVLFKPNDPVGGPERFEGFLPGNLWEKIKPHLKPFIDAHEESELDCIPFRQMILHPNRSNDYGDIREKTKPISGGYLPPHNEAISITNLGFLRGRSFTDTLILVDEAQNFTPYEMKVIISRLGMGSKCIVLGDPAQLDQRKSSRDINGLTSAIKHFIDKPYSSLIKLTHNYRNQASEDTLSWKVYSH